MSLGRNLTISTMIAYGLTYLFMAGSPATLIASYGLLYSGLAAIFVLGTYNNYHRPWHHSSPLYRAGGYQGYYDQYGPSVNTFFYHVGRAFMATPGPRYQGGTYYPSSAAPSSGATYKGTTITPTGYSTPAAPPSAGARHISSTIQPLEGSVYAPPPVLFSGPPPAASPKHLVSSTITPINGGAAPTPPSAGAKHVSTSIKPV